MPRDPRDQYEQQQVAGRLLLHENVEIMRKAEKSASRTTLKISDHYVDSASMRVYIDAYNRDVRDLQKRVVQDFQKVYKTVVDDTVAHFTFLHKICEEEGLYLIEGGEAQPRSDPRTKSSRSQKKDEKKKRERVELGLVSREACLRRRDRFLAICNSRMAELADPDLPLSKIAEIQEDCERALKLMTEAIGWMFVVAAENSKLNREKDRLRIAKLRLYLTPVGWLGGIAGLFGAG